MTVVRLLTRRWLLSALVAMVLLAGGPLFALGAAPVDFTGVFASVPAPGDRASEHITLHITQTAASVQIDRGGAGTMTLPLDGSEGAFTTPTGFAGKGSVKWKGKELWIDSTVVASSPGQQTVRIHTVERWQLSGDGKVLKIHSADDFPDMPKIVSGGDASKSTVSYRRVEK